MGRSAAWLRPGGCEGLQGSHGGVAQWQSAWPITRRAAGRSRLPLPGRIPSGLYPAGRVTGACGFDPRRPHGPLAQSGSVAGFYPVGSGFDSLAAHPAPLAQRTERPASTRLVGGSSPPWRTHDDHGPLEETVNSPGSHPGECGFEARTGHASPYRLMARPPAFQAGEDGPEPSGGTAG